MPTTISKTPKTSWNLPLKRPTWALGTLTQKPINLLKITGTRYSDVFFFYGMLPLAHWGRLHGFEGECGTFFLRVLFSFVLLAIGSMFYILRIPERWFRNYFDIWFNSHQIWHTFTFLGALCQCCTGLDYLIRVGCKCSDVSYNF